jgi:hypothetical protein
VGHRADMGEKEYRIPVKNLKETHHLKDFTTD